ncbi:MAG: hypothetical protein ACI8UO_006732, partial [Verrucomicrobiales bacterium]
DAAQPFGSLQGDSEFKLGVQRSSFLFRHILVRLGSIFNLPEIYTLRPP